MTLINLTERYLSERSPSLLERVYLMRSLELYWASTLSSIEEHFSMAPPRRTDRRSGQRSAYVLMYDIGVKRVPEDPFDEMDERMLRLLDEGCDAPSFYVGDGTMTRAAIWMAGKSGDFIETSKRFGLDTDHYERIPKVFLQYRHAGRRGWLALRSLDGFEKPQAATESLMDRITRWAEELPGLSPQPVGAYRMYHSPDIA